MITKQLTFLCFIVVQISFLNLETKGGTLSELEPIGVTATRSEKPVLETPGSSSIITANEMQDRGAVNLVDALKYEPGVSVPFDFSGADSLVPYLGTG